jgi:hypothetical protein
MMIKKILILTVLLAGAFFISCGIDEYYYLPQVPESEVTINLNTEAVISLPTITQSEAISYIIFYRIYVSNFLTSSSANIAQISPSLASDYNFFSQYTNPANTTSILSMNTFRNRNYFELEFEGADRESILSKSGGTLRIRFPTVLWGEPVASLNELNDGEEFSLRRSSKQLISPEPRNDLFFRNTPELRSYENSNANINADVAGRTVEMQYSYVSMYIVTYGVNPGNFNSIYSKPTHIGVFKLPDTN